MSSSQLFRVFRQSPATGMLLYATLVVLLLTLMPFRFAWSDNLHWLVSGAWPDVLLNVALFFPVGFLLRLAFPVFFWKALAGAALYGFLLSLSIESMQLFLPARHSTISDLISNTLGASLGAVAYGVFKARLNQHPLSRVMALEYPLMFSIYLLTFLLWLNGSGLADETSRLYLSPLLAVFGARVFGSILAYQSAHKNSYQAARDSALLVMAWMSFASVPAALNNPGFVLVLIVASGLLAMLQVFWLRRYGLSERRFELDTLRPLISLYLIYVFLFMVWPLDFEFSRWYLSVEWDYLGYSQFYFVQIFVGFTLLGFVIAEFYGRHNSAFIFYRHLIWLLVILCVIALLEGFHVQQHLSIKELLVLTVGYILGLALYYQQRQIICRKILINSTLTNS